MNNSPKISVIIPVYNVEKYIRECLDSLVKQTLSGLEFICINDGSTDKSLEILKDYAKKDDRFVVVSQNNQGQGVARNKGLEIAKGKYIAFVDPDDYIELNAFEVVYKKIEEAKTDIAQFNIKSLNDFTKELKNKPFAKLFRKLSDKKLEDKDTYSWHDLSKKGWLKNYSLAVWNKVYNADFIKKNNIKFAPTKLGEDEIFSLSALLLAKKIVFIEDYLYVYRSRAGSAVNKASEENFKMFENIKMFKEFLKEHSLFDALKAEYQGYIISTLGQHYNCIPKRSEQKYLDRCKELLSEDDFKAFKRKIKRKELTFWQKIFSIKNKKKNGKKYKYYTILGIHLTFKKQKKK